MNLRVKTKGVLYKELRKTHIIQSMLILSLVMYFGLVFIIMSFSKLISSVLIGWYFFSVSISKAGDNSTLDNILGAPFRLPLEISYNIFAFFMKRKYPNISEKNFERYRKLKKLNNLTK